MSTLQKISYLAFLVLIGTINKFSHNPCKILSQGIEVKLQFLRKPVLASTSNPHIDLLKGRHTKVKGRFLSP